MTSFSPGDWVRIDWHPDASIEGCTGTVEQRQPDVADRYDELFAIRLDRPLIDGTTHADAFASELVLLQSRDIITVVTAPDGSAVAAVHDRTDPGGSIDLVCSQHGRFCTLRPDQGATEAQRQDLRGQAAKTVGEHRNSIKHAPVTPFRVATPGGQT